ncbi:hypothetical protein KFJ24_03700 [Marinobacter sediminum]|uniref:hypothetical protein n=1 Tax=Marinobacter sediminum TaxID=256323 RepID=UPI00202DF45E|nr:hypothetical protein [Marinobacter sediminum]MCM0611581.1 hypothetical protein [Marinobacter sediminum]
MAENQRTVQSATEPDEGAVLRPGRAADPVPQGSRVAVSEVSRGNEESPGVASTERAPARAPRVAEESEPHSSEPLTGETPGAGIEQTLAESRQRKLRLLLRQCDRVLLMDFDLLAMNDWPDNYTLARARRSRDFWLFGALVAAIVFLSGLSGFVPAWVAGTGFGLFVVILLLGVPSIRRIYSSKPSYLDVIIKRQRMLRDARRHVAHLEGDDGLIWQCARMAEFSPALKNTRFSDLLRLSERHSLPRHLSRREHVRLYLIYLLEAEKAYGRVQKAFFEGNQVAIDRGWQNVVAEPETRT